MRPGIVARARAALTAFGVGWSWRSGVTSSGGWSGSKFAGATSYPTLAGLDHVSLRAKVRKAYWDSPDARAIETRIVNSTINWGLMLEASPVWELIDPQNNVGAEVRRAWKKRVQQLFGLWMASTDPDAAGKMTGYQLQAFGFRTKIRDGECFIVCRYWGTWR